MNRRLLVLLLSLLFIPAAAAPRYARSLNDNWSFHKEGDAAVQTVSLPHTWNALDCTDDEPGYWRGAGWYEKSVELNDDLSGKRVFVRFEGANQEADLWVNGVHAGNHKGGYTAFIFDISELVRSGSNEFRVKVDNSHNEGIPPMSADFTFFGGIYRDVSLLFVPENHISVEHYASDGVYISTPEVSSCKASVKIETHLCLARPDRKMTLEQTILSPDGTAVATIRRSLSNASGDLVVRADAVVEKPVLWDIDTPELYTLVSRLLDKKGNVIDSQRNTFGIRCFSFDSEKGFFLNGRHLKLIGTNRHQDFKGLGNALPDEKHRRDVRLLKDMGGNFLRISHYPQDRIISEQCDSLGILSSMEIPVVDRIGYADDFTPNCVHMAREMVYQYFNHPSLIVWAYMNEVLLRERPWKEDGFQREEYYGKVKNCAVAIDDAIRLADPSRPTMIPFHSSRKRYKESGLWEVPDIVGLNLYYGWYYNSLDYLGPALEEFHQLYPGKPLFVTEYGADADARLHSFEPENQDYTCDYALLFHRKYIPVLLEKEYVSGATVWNLNDFHSESRGFAVPHFNLKGLITSERVPKDSYWMYRALFGKGPFLKIGGSEWKIRGGQASCGVCVQPVEVYATAAEVELSQNGHSLGVKPVIDGFASFDVPFTDGRNVLEARGSDGTSDSQSIDFFLIPEDLSQFREINVMLGSKRYFEDRGGGRIWIPDQAYRPGSWGYVGGTPAPIATAGIANTDLDPIFQTRRDSLEVFKADVPDGNYSVSLYCVEAETNSAFIRDFTVDVTEGKGLSLDFTSGELPVPNAIRIVKGPVPVSVKEFGAKGDGVTIKGFQDLPNHPRLYFSEKDFRHLRRATFGHCGNQYVRNISAGIIKAADSLAMFGDYPYRKDASGRRILENCSRPVLRCLFQTAYAYKMTGEKKYLDRAISLLETVCAYPDWNPRHYLDVAELALGVALAYDWLYGEIPSDLRDRVTEKLIHEALETSLESRFAKQCSEMNNRNQVCNAGLAIAALAVWEKAPSLCRDVLESSIARNREAMASLYAPDGIYAEGAVYWSYGTTFEVALLDALESVLGTDYGLSDAPGFDRTPYFEMNMFSSTGKEQDYFNYADSEDALTLPGCIWYFVRRSGDSGFLWPAREIYEQPSRLYDELCDDRLAFVPLYEAMHAQIKTIAEPDAAPFFGDGPTPLAVLRTGWDKNDLYLAVKGGSASSSHAHMDAGSFVFDAYGTRWACDPPRPSYAATEKWWKDNGKKRSEVIWDFFSYRSTSHNTLTVNGKKHRISGKAHLVKRLDSPDCQGACIDMGEIFAEDLSYAERTVAIVNGSRLEVVDVLETGAAPASIRWNWVTPAAVTLCPDGILLSKDGVEMKLSSADTSIPLHWRIWPLNEDTIGLDPEDFLPCAKGLSIVGFECDIPATTKVTLKTVCEKLPL